MEDKQRIERAINEVIDAMNRASQMGERKLSDWAEYFLVEVLGVNEKCIDEDVKLRAMGYLLITNLVGGER